MDKIIIYRNVCINELDMENPPNPDDGYFYNVYIHAPENKSDIFLPYGWMNGQGTDENDYPFLALPFCELSSLVNTGHETFHIFNTAVNPPVILMPETVNGLPRLLPVDNLITQGFYEKTTQLPQEFLF